MYIDFPYQHYTFIMIFFYTWKLFDDIPKTENFMMISLLNQLVDGTPSNRKLYDAVPLNVKLLSWYPFLTWHLYIYIPLNVKPLSLYPFLTWNLYINIPLNVKPLSWYPFLTWNLYIWWFISVNVKSYIDIYVYETFMMQSL